MKKVIIVFSIFLVVLFGMMSITCASEIPPLRGDANGDKELTIIDVRMILQKVLNESYTEADYPVLDYNQDNEVGLLDVRFLLQNIINGLKVDRVTLNKTSLSMKVGDVETLIATVEPTNVDNTNVTWSSSNESVAKVENGKVTAVAEGTATITVTTEAENKTESCQVTVEPLPPVIVSVTGVSLNKSTLNLIVGNEETLTATITPSNATNKNVTWSSSNESVAKVANGKVTAVAKGTATITVKTNDGEKTAKCTVNVEGKNLEVEVTSYNGKYDGEGHRIILKVTSADWNGTAIWSGTKDVANFGDGDLVTSNGKANEPIGLIPERKNVTGGPITVNYRIRGGSYYKDLTGSSTLNIVKADGSISYNEKQITKIYGNPSFTNTLTNLGDGEVTYKSSDETIAVVSSSTGLVTIRKPGNVTITATISGDGTNYTYANKEAIYSLTINQRPLTITAKNQTITYGGTIETGVEQITASSNLLSTSGHSIGQITLTPSITNAGTGDIKPSNVKILASNNTTDVTSNYKIEYIKGTLTINKATNPITVTAQQTWGTTYSTVNQNKTFTGATNAQGIVTYAISSQVNSTNNSGVNYFTISGTTLSMNANTPAGKYTVVIKATAAGNNNYNSGSKDITMTVTVNKQNVNPPTNLNVTVDGIVTWTASNNATGYQISFDGTNFTSANSGNNYLSKITASTGPRTIYVRAINSNTTNYITPSSKVTKSVTVYKLILNKGTGIDSTSGAGNYISGKPIGINATVNSEYTWSNWTFVNGTRPANANNQSTTVTISENTTLTATAIKTERVNGIHLDKKRMTLSKNETATLKHIINPSDATNQNVTWESDDEGIATVVNGKVTAVAKGTATITAKTEDSGKTASCKVTVQEGQVIKKDDIEVHFIDVDGDAIFIKAPEVTIMIDGGTSADADTVIDYLKNECNIKTIDYYIGTHGHGDHIGAAWPIINTFKIPNIVVGTPKSSTDNRITK